MYLKLAWRNIWRNKRRTIITIASIFFAVILSTLMMSMKEGIYANMIKSMIGAYVGYVQVQHPDYVDEKKLDNALQFTDSLKQFLTNHSSVSEFLPRMESFALAASEEITKGVLVVGVDPEKEAAVNALEERVSAGSYFKQNDSGALVGDALAEYLRIGVGDTIILMGQGYHGVNAVGKYHVIGLVKFGSPELSKQMVFLPIGVAQEMYNTENMVTSIVLAIPNVNQATEASQKIGKDLKGNYAVLPWEEITPDLKNMIETDRVEGYVFMFILYMVIAFGIFGTMVMMMTERKHEFGIMVGVGMKRIKLALIVWLEVLIISVIGAFVGILGALPVCGYFYLNPVRFGDEMGAMVEEYGMEAVLQTSIQPGVFIQQAIVVTLISVILASYAFIKLSKMDAVEYMRS